MPIELDTTIALINEFEYLTYMGVQESEFQVNAERTATFINRASQEIKHYCGGRVFVTPSSQIQEIFNGDGTKDYYTLHGRIADTTPATQVLLYLWQSQSWVEQTTTSFPRAFDAEKGRVWFNNGHTFYEGEDNWRIDYKPGWAIESVPQDLKGACCSIVKRLFMLADGKEGLSTEAFADSNTTYNLGELIGVKEKLVLNNYRRRFL